MASFLNLDTFRHKAIPRVVDIHQNNTIFCIKTIRVKLLTNVCHKDVCACFYSRVTLLELLFAQLREEDSDECGVPPSVARFLASTFQKGCGAVLTLATGSVSSEEVWDVNQVQSSKLCAIGRALFDFKFSSF